MRPFRYNPQRWDKKADAHWKAGRREQAVKQAMATLQAMADPDADAFIQPAFYLAQTDRFREAFQLWERGIAQFPDNPMLLLSLGTGCTRCCRHRQAIGYLDRFVDLGHSDWLALDALAFSNGVVGNLMKSRLFGALALSFKDEATAGRRDRASLDRSIDPAGKTNVIAFTLYGSDPRYLRGALHNLIAARDLYPGWTCRFYVDSTVDQGFLDVLCEEGAELIVDARSGDDRRRLLTRRFLVADDPMVGYFIVRDCDSVISARERAAVDQWLESGLAFHVMRDWYSHTDLMLAGMWGGIANMLPNMQAAIDRFIDQAASHSHWDQQFQREEIWPLIRDDCLVHDRFFESYRAQPFPTPDPPDPEHVGHNEYSVDTVRQHRVLASFQSRLPILELDKPSINFRFSSQL